MEESKITGYQCKVVLDSLNSGTGNRLTTFSVRYPLFVHQDFLRHRMISRSVSSNRAIPTKKQLDLIIDDPVYPLRFGKNISGMQPSKEEVDDPEVTAAFWDSLRESTVEGVELLLGEGLHKQWANRPLYAFQWVNEVLTATDWCNLFTLRYHDAAQDELQHIVGMMLDAYTRSTPQILQPGEWHIPFILEEEKESPLSTRLKVSAARVARTSYRTHEGKISTVEDDMRLYEKLAVSKPVHSSPMEAQALAMKSNMRWEEDWTTVDLEDEDWGEKLDKKFDGRIWTEGKYQEAYYSNFQGFLPFRSFIKGNVSHEFEYNGTTLKDHIVE